MEPGTLKATCPWFGVGILVDREFAQKVNNKAEQRKVSDDPEIPEIDIEIPVLPMKQMISRLPMVQALLR